jgi:hypothetical protein
MTLSPNDFPCIEDYLYKFKKIRLLLKYYKIDLKDDLWIYVIIFYLGSAYSILLYTFYVTEEALGCFYQPPTLESFCNSLIRAQDDLLQLGVIITTHTYNKALVS